MSEYRVCKTKVGHEEIISFMKFDNKEDAEHYAKNQSTLDDQHGYQVQKNAQGDFRTIKTYLKGDIF